MILYKNVDISDLESIMQNGISSIEYVYLFRPNRLAINSFPEYGVALLEINCDEAKIKLFSMNNSCREYITEKINPFEIVRVIIPEVFRPYIKISSEIPVIWCKLNASVYIDDNKAIFGEDIIKQFACSAQLTNSLCDDFFIGKTKDGRKVNLCTIGYEFEPDLIFVIEELYYIMVEGSGDSFLKAYGILENLYNKLNLLEDTLKERYKLLINNLTSSNYEGNAIHDLIQMRETKKKIKYLESVY